MIRYHHLFVNGFAMDEKCGDDEIQSVIGKTILSIEEITRDHEDHTYINFTDGSRLRCESSEWLRTYVDPPRFIGGLVK